LGLGFPDYGDYPPAYTYEAPAYWYYCPSYGAYYPSVGSCPEAWVPVPASWRQPGAWPRSWLTAARSGCCNRPALSAVWRRWSGTTWSEAIA